jgi:hypothetical protein
MSDTYGKMLELSANWEDTESIVQACADYCDNEINHLRELRPAYDAKLKYIEQLEKENDHLRELLRRWTKGVLCSGDLMEQSQAALEGKE